MVSVSPRLYINYVLFRSKIFATDTISRLSPVGYTWVSGSSFILPARLVFSYTSCVNLHQLYSQSSASWRILQFPW